jgi:ergothioneine biosynthesis protein EgtB
MSSNAIAKASDATNSPERQFASEYRRVRAFSEAIAAPLSPEDCVIQSMPDVSPTRWHLAHTTWFFETFLLKHREGYEVFNREFDYLFNSYYNTLGDQFPRERRGLLSRPTVDEVLQYRKHVDQSLLQFLESGNLTRAEEAIVEIGLNHEQQHQELMLTDIKHVLSCNPLFPCYSHASLGTGAASQPSPFVDFQGGLYKIGHAGEGFAYDNESPRHQVFLNPFSLSSRLVSVRQYLDFIADGGYQDPRWWLSLGWQTVTEEGWNAPLYWLKQDCDWFVFTLSGLHPIELDVPVCHVSYFEADAYARWAGARLPCEAEWEVAGNNIPVHGNFADDLISSGMTVHPIGSKRSAAADQPKSSALSEMFGNTWQWMCSPYTPYPGYTTAEGALGEYNGKFMCGQYVLRGGSCATPSGHVRRTYRNFFPPSARWQFSGIRLARDTA